MKKVTFLLMSLLFISISYAQNIDFELKSTETHKDKVFERNYGFESIGKNSSHFYYVHLPFIYTFGYRSVGSNEVPNILMYDHDLKLIKKQAISLETDNKVRDYRGIVMLDNKIYILSSFQNTNHKKHYLFVQTMNSSTLKTNDDLRKIGEIDYSGFNKYSDTHFKLEKSEDKSKVLIYYNIINKKNVNLKYGMYIFDNSFHLKWKHENIVPKIIEEGEFLYKQFKIDNQGNVFIHGLYKSQNNNENVYLPFSNKSLFGSNYTYFSKYPVHEQMILYYTNNGKKLDEVIINIPKKLIHDMTFTPIEGGNILCAGSYSEQNLVSIKGLFTFKYNMKTGKYGTVYSKELERKIENTGLKEKMYESFKKKSKNQSEWDPFDYQCSELIKSKNGEYICTAEQFLEGVEVSKSGNVVTRTPIYIMNDIFHFNISSSGSIEKINQIHKRQYTQQSTMFSSYYFFMSGEKKYYLFTDIIKKETLTKVTAFEDWYLIEIDKEGNQKSQVIHKSDFGNNSETYLLPKSGVILSKSNIVFAALSFRLNSYAFKKLMIH